MYEGWTFLFRGWTAPELANEYDPEYNPFSDEEIMWSDILEMIVWDGQHYNTHIGWYDFPSETFCTNQGYIGEVIAYKVYNPPVDVYSLHQSHLANQVVKLFPEENKNGEV